MVEDVCSPARMVPTNADCTFDFRGVGFQSGFDHGLTQKKEPAKIARFGVKWIKPKPE